eukprot:g40544.t1
MERDGDFLIRESHSSPGDYVLSCTWKHEPLHFKIIRVVLRQFAEMKRNKDKSGSHPNILDYGNDKKPLQSAQSDSYLSGGPKDVTQANGTYKSVRPSSLMYRTGSDPLINPKVFLKHFGSQNNMVLRGSDGQLHCKAPPKPLRIPSAMILDTVMDPTLDGNVYCELVPHIPQAGQIQTHMERLRTMERLKGRIRRTDTDFGLLDLDAYSASMKTHHEEDNEDDDGDWSFVWPQIETTSSFKLDSFTSILLPVDNKPLDPSVLKRLKEIFCENDAKTTAQHILKVDCE